jgi:hypothetical protein
MHRHGKHILLTYSANVKTLQKNGNTMGQSISHLQTSNTAYDLVMKLILYSESWMQQNCGGVSRKFHLIQVLSVLIIRIPDYSECKIFPLKTGFRLAQVPFMTGFNV